MGDLSFQNNAPDPLRWKRIAGFQIRTGEIDGEVVWNSFRKEVTVDASGMNRRSYCDKF